MHLVTDSCLGEKDPAVIGDVEIICQPQPAVVVHRIEAAVGFVGCLLDLAIRRDAIQAHAAYAAIEVVLSIEGHSQRLAADVRIDLHRLIVRREEANDVAMPRSGIQVVVSIEDDILRRFDAPLPNQSDIAQLVVLLERPTLANLR